MASKPTVQEILNYYSNLLIIQYNQKPKAVAEIKTWVETIISNNLIFDVRDGFCIDANISSIAVGVQLDIIDKYVGVGRYYNGVALSDSDFLTLILIKIIQNNSSHSHQAIDASMYYFFGTNLVMYSTGNMVMTYFVNQTSNVIQAALAKKILPRPMGVEADTINFVPSTHKAFWFAKADTTYGLPLAQAGFTQGYFPKIY
jgi:hypothetical protein